MCWEKTEGAVCHVVSMLGGPRRSKVWCALLAAACLILLPGAARAQAGTAGNGADPNAGRALRQMMLTMPAVEPTLKFPRVYGVLMDVPIGNKHTATVFANALGDASLYTTGTFGVIGGGGHEAVRKAALEFVLAADRYYDSATPATTFPYPAADKVRFYLLTFNGVRVFEADLEAIRRGTSKSVDFFNLGNAVITELRVAAEASPTR